MLVPGFVDQMDFISGKVEINNIMESNKSCDSVDIVLALFFNLNFLKYSQLTMLWRLWPLTSLIRNPVLRQVGPETAGSPSV